MPWGKTLDSSQDYFDSAVQGVSLHNYTNCGIGEGGDGSCGIGTIKWELVLGLFVQWVFLFLALSNGKKLVSKIVMFTMPLPFVMLVIIFIYGLTLDNILEGITVYIGHLDVAAISSVSTWVDAVSSTILPPSV